MAKTKRKKLVRHGFVILSAAGEFDLTPMGNVILYQRRSYAVMGTRAGWPTIAKATLTVSRPSTNGARTK